MTIPLFLFIGTCNIECNGKSACHAILIVRVYLFILFNLPHFSIYFVRRANNAKINFREKEKKVLDQILGQGKYDARIRPSGGNGTGKKSIQILAYKHF